MSFLKNPRIMKEIKAMKDYKQSLPEIFQDIEINCSNLLGPHYFMIKGPTDSVYEGGKFRIELKFTSDFPHKPPHLQFLTKIFHPNISMPHGDICVDILKDQWVASMSITTIFLSLSVLLQTPNPDSPLNSTAAYLYKTNEKLFNKKVKKYMNLENSKTTQEVSDDTSLDDDMPELTEVS